MEKAKHYPSPPIIDSVIELRFTTQFSDPELAAIVRAVKPKYDKYEGSGEVDVKVRLEGQNVFPEVGAPRPVHIFSNADQNDFFRAERGKLHWSRLPPYDCWETFEARVITDLRSLPKKIGFRALERIGVRFQNRIDVPLNESGVTFYENYLSVHIALPPLLDPHDAYLWAVTKAFKDRKIGTKVSSGIVPAVVPGTLAILLDIDVFATVDLPSSIVELSGKLGELRALKNEIFETCVTDEARASFE